MPPVLFFDKFLVSTNHQISINAHIGAPRTRGVPRVDKEIFWSWWSWLHWLRCWKCSKFNSLRNQFTTPRLLRNFQSPCSQIGERTNLWLAYMNGETPSLQSLQLHLQAPAWELALLPSVGSQGWDWERKSGTTNRDIYGFFYLYCFHESECLRIIKN